MNQNRLKVTIIVLVMFFINGCFSHVGTQENNFLMKRVSAEDKKLFSYYNDEVLYRYNSDIKLGGGVLYSYHNDLIPFNDKILEKVMRKLYQYKNDGIRITKNGFYPNCKIADTTLTSDIVQDKQYCYETKYMKQFLGGLLTRFNMNKFMHDINEANLKELRLNIISIKKLFPSLNIQRLKEKEIMELSTLSLYEKQKKVLTYQSSTINDITNPSEELKRIALTSAKRECKKIEGFWNNKKNYCKLPNYISVGEALSKSHSDSGGFSSSGGSSSSGGYSGSSSSRSNNSNYVPGRGYYRPGQGHGHSSQY